MRRGERKCPHPDARPLAPGPGGETSIFVQRQQSHPLAARFHDDQRALRERFSVVTQHLQKQETNLFRTRIRAPHLNHARSGCVGDRQQISEIKIVGKDHVIVYTGPLHDDGIGCARFADHAPMPGCTAMIFEPAYPTRRKIDVDEQVHAGSNGRSCSSSRHAAYARA
jgi:hypothetical protein